MRSLVPEAEVEEMGASAVPGSLTKGDVDLLVRVPPAVFAAARAALGGRYEVHQLDNWTPSYASFQESYSNEPHLGVQLVIADSEADRKLTGTREALRADPALLERYNELKREHEGSDPTAYWRAKTEFLESICRDER